MDDYEDTVIALCAWLHATGYTAVGVNTGRQAVVMAQVFSPEVVLLDFGLPDMNGYEVAHALRGLDPRVTIIVITGWTRPGLREGVAENCDIDDFYLKPVDVTQLQPWLRYGRHAA